MAPRASVIVPNLNCPLVHETVAALQRQRPSDEALEILVVGRDEHRLVPRDGTVRFVETPQNLRAGAARNLGVEKASGSVLLFTDADCRPDKGWAATLLQRLESCPIVGGSVRFSLSANRWAVADNIASFHELLTDRPAESLPRGPLGTLNLAVTRTAWDRVGPFDESLATSEDIDWVLRARGLGIADSFEPAAVVEHAAIRTSRRALEDHAVWYGLNFRAFCEKHPCAFAAGFTWRSRRRLALTRPLKAWLAALQIFTHHPGLWSAWRAFPGVVLFKLAWYRAILDTWQEV